MGNKAAEKAAKIAAAEAKAQAENAAQSKPRRRGLTPEAAAAVAGTAQAGEVASVEDTGAPSADAAAPNGQPNVEGEGQVQGDAAPDGDSGEPPKGDATAAAAADAAVPPAAVASPQPQPPKAPLGSNKAVGPDPHATEAWLKAQGDADPANLELVAVNVPKGFRLRFENGGVLKIQAGAQKMERCLAEHWYSKANKVSIVDTKRKG